MRDPTGRLHFEDNKAIRELVNGIATPVFLLSDAASQLVRGGKLIQYDVDSVGRIVSPKYPFVSLPFEWCDTQLHAAAELTIEISSSLYPHQYELKDASVWNIIFDGTNPIFCDHLSFQAITTKQWWAFGQFVRHFSLPLGVSNSRGIKAYKIFRSSRDGLAQSEARQILGFKRFSTRLWPLLLNSLKSNKDSQLDGLNHRESLHPYLYKFCEWSLGGRKRISGNHNHWVTYGNSRAHYSGNAKKNKHQVVARWIERLKPSWVIDLGANTGEFVNIAVDHGANVIAVDSDHDCIDYIYKNSTGNAHVYPVIANLGDLCGGSGWLGSEHSGLMDRLTGMGDVVMALALLHHLAISESIPLDYVAEMIAKLTKTYAMVEFLGEDDPLLCDLSQQRRRLPSEFSLQNQKKAFEKHFIYLAEHRIENSQRSLVLMQKK